MKLVTFSETGRLPRPGLMVEGGVIDLAAAGYADALGFLGATQAAQDEAAKTEVLVPLNAVKLLAPILAPPRIFGIGLNYKEHAAESKMKVQAVPTVFMKLPSSVVGPGAEVILPRASTQVDYEAELAVVIGKAGYQIAAADWEQHVFGYTIVNDVSARDVQLATSQWTLGKSFPTFTPLGPWIVSKDEVGDPHTLAISLDLAGERLQDSTTSLLLFGTPALIEYISGIVPLQVGDVISTGTPPGVGLGRTPQRWIQPGEEMVITVEKIGELRNRAVAEPPASR